MEVEPQHVETEEEKYLRYNRKVDCSICGSHVIKRTIASHYKSQKCKKEKILKTVPDLDAVLKELVLEQTTSYSNKQSANDKIVIYISTLSTDEKLNLKTNLEFLKSLESL